MSTIILRAELIEARKASIACPRGIAGALHTLRLRRHFQQRRRLHSIAIGDSDFTQNRRFSGDKFFEEHGKPVDHQQVPGGGYGHTNRQGFSEYASRQEAEDASNPRAPAQRRVHWQDQHKARVIETVEQPMVKTISSSPVVRSRLGRATRHDLFDLGLFWNQVAGEHVDDKKQAETFYEGLRTADPYVILRGLLRLTVDGAGDVSVALVIRDLSQTTFSEVLRCLDAGKIVGQQLQILKHVSPNHPVYPGHQLHHPKLGNYYICKVFMHRILTIVQARTGAGFSLSLADYRCLLRFARTTGESKVSEKLWRTMHRDRITPDTECYNHYIATKVWSSSHNPFQRFNLRVIPANQKRRSTSSSTPLTFRGYSIGIRGLKSEVMRLFNQMVTNGCSGDEEIFCSMMVAFGREGDVNGVQSILARVWGLDVPELVLKGEDFLSPPRHFYPDSLLRPSNLLLFTVAHIYGINNQILPALRIVDYLSRQYSINISVSVWEELLDKTYLLSQRRYLNVQAQGGSTGQLLPQAVIDLWDTFTAAPYVVNPTMNMYDKIVVTLLRKHRFDAAWRKMKEGLAKHINLVSKYGRSLAAFERQKSLVRDERLNSPSLGRERGRQIFDRAAHLKRQLEYDYLLMHRSRQYIRRWCRITISESNHMSNRLLYSGFQNFQRKFCLFLPRCLKYRTPTGHIKIFSGSDMENKARAKTFLRRRRWEKSLLRVERELPSISEDLENK